MTRRHRRSTARMVAWYLLALAAVGAVAVADELVRHGLLLVLALAGPAGYVAGRIHGRRRTARGPAARRADDDEAIRLRAEVEALRAERDQAREATRAAWEASSEPRSTGGVTRDRILADPRSGARPLGGES